MSDATSLDQPSPTARVGNAWDGGADRPAPAPKPTSVSAARPSEDTPGVRAEVATVSSAPAVVLDLLRSIKALEQSDGSWPGADVVDAVTEWFTTFGIDPQAPPPAASPRMLPCRHCTADIRIPDSNWAEQWSGPAGSQVWRDKAGAAHCDPRPDSAAGRRELDRSRRGYRQVRHEPITVDLGGGRCGLVIAVQHDSDTGQAMWVIRPLQPDAPALRLPAADAVVLTPER
jgi:hypothetical protein